MTGCWNIASWRCTLRSARYSRAWLTGAMLLTLSACTTLEPRDAATEPDAAANHVPYYLKAELDDAFEAIDQATRRIAREPRRVMEPEPSAEVEPDLLARIVGRFKFSECPDGGPALQWAEWFGARPDYMERVLNRAHPWLYDIANELDARDLPGELALLPIVESAFDPFA